MPENVYYFMFLVFLYHVEAAKNDYIAKEDVKKWDEEFVEEDVYLFPSWHGMCHFHFYFR